MLSVEVAYKKGFETVTVNGDIIASQRYSNVDYDEIRLIASDTFLASKELTYQERRYWNAVHTRTNLMANFPLIKDRRRRR